MQAPIIAKECEDLFSEAGAHSCGREASLQPTKSDFGGQQAQPEIRQTKVAGGSSLGSHHRL